MPPASPRFRHKDRGQQRRRAVSNPPSFAAIYAAPQLEFWDLNGEQWRQIAPWPYERRPTPAHSGLHHLTLS